MERQRNKPQMKEQENFPEELTEMEVSNLSDIRFRVIIVRMLNSMKNDIGTIKNDKSEMKNAVSEIKATLKEYTIGSMKHMIESAT